MNFFIQPKNYMQNIKTLLKGNPEKQKHFLCFSFLFISLLLQQKIFAQDGLINDDFSTGNTSNWSVPTANATGQLVNGQFVITSSLQGNGKFRGDFRKSGSVTLHAGDYPIIAIKINKPPRCNWFFDTNLGSYNNSNNNSTKIVTDKGNVYYWDLSTGKLGTTTLSTTQSTTLSLFQFKIADIDFSSTELATGDHSYEVDWVKTFKSVDELRTYLNPSGSTNPVFEYTGTFTHPGLLHNNEDLARIKDLVTRQVFRPYKSYQFLTSSPRASFNYTKAGPFKYFTRDASLTIQTPTGTVSGGTAKGGVESDVLAAYYNALMWNITGNELHAKKSVEILDAYSGYTIGITGADAELNGLYGFMLANAAELMRYTYSGWPADRIQQCQTMLQNVFYPTLQNFRPCAHGNWDIICMKALMSIAVFSDDNTMFNKVINYFYYGEGNGSIKNYVLTDAGQLQESNRDQPHSMLAIGSLAELAEVALKQGVDLYAANNNAIMRGYEYTAKYNLGYDVPFQTSYDFCEKNYQDYTPESISSNGRGSFRSVFEIAYNHYVYRKGKSMPNTLEALATVIGPEGAPFGADNPGYGSLFFYLNPDSNYVFNGTGNTSVGLIDDNFNGYADGWITPTTGAVAKIGTQEITITTKKQSNGTYRGDFKRSAGAILHPGNYPILAIKMKKPSVVNLTFDTNIGSYGNGANKWTGKVGSDIYYYDLTKSFGAGPAFLSTGGATTLSTFQFKVAGIPAGGDTVYTVDWVKTFKSVNDILAYDPNTGLIDDNFTSTTDGWVAATSGATATSENGQLRVLLAKQTNGSNRGDIKRTAGATLFPGNYPIVAVKLKKPGVVNVTFDTNLGSFGNGSNKYTGKIGESIFYFDMTKTGFGSANTILTSPTALTLLQFKIADITSGETSYQVDWVKTVKTVDELQGLIFPMYQTITFPSMTEKEAREDDFSPAAASSGLPVVYSSSNISVATIVNGLIHLVAKGTTEITAHQQGNDSYYAADEVKQTLTVYMLPTVKAKNLQVAVDGTGKASITPEQVDDGSVSYSGALSLTLDKTEFTCSDIGSPITITLTGTDADGHYDSAKAQILVVDTTRPSITAPADQFFCYDQSGMFTVPKLSVSDNCAISSVVYGIDGSTTRSGKGESASGVFNVGVSTIRWTVEDVHGNLSTATTTVTVNAPISVIIPDVYALNANVDAKNTIYIGYGPASLTLSANVSGGTEPYSYQWGNGQSSQSITVSETGTYLVSAKDSKGCSESASIIINVIDVRCGNNDDKVMICHNGNAICVASSAVQAHLSHGDHLGACNGALTQKKNILPTTVDTEGNVIVYPNPASELVVVQLNHLQPKATVRLFDAYGRMIFTDRMTGIKKAISVKSLAAGVYYVQVKNGSELIIQRVIKQ